MHVEVSYKKTDSFPSLYLNKQDKCIVLFRSQDTGTVVREGAKHKVGDHHRSWVECTNEDHWQRLPNGSSVTLIQ